MKCHQNFVTDVKETLHVRNKDKKGLLFECLNLHQTYNLLTNTEGPNLMNCFAIPVLALLHLYDTLMYHMDLSLKEYTTFLYYQGALLDLQGLSYKDDTLSSGLNTEGHPI